MKNIERLVYGIALTAAIYFAAVLLSPLIKINNAFITKSFITYVILFSLSALAILLMKKHLRYSISMPKFKLMLRPVVITLMSYVGLSLLLSFIAKLSGAPQGEVHPAIRLHPLQFLCFIVLAASIAEEILFRGFFLNLLAPFKQKGIRILNRKISLSVMISALLFGLAHLSLISYGYSAYFLIRTIVFTSSIGLIAGYYQEKYNNNAYAIVVHMTSNLLGMLPLLLMALYKI